MPPNLRPLSSFRDPLLEYDTSVRVTSRPTRERTCPWCWECSTAPSRLTTPILGTVLSSNLPVPPSFFQPHLPHKKEELIHDVCPREIIAAMSEDDTELRKIETEILGMPVPKVTSRYRQLTNSSHGSQIISQGRRKVLPPVPARDHRPCQSLRHQELGPILMVDRESSADLHKRGSRRSNPAGSPHFHRRPRCADESGRLPRAPRVDARRPRKGRAKLLLQPTRVARVSGREPLGTSLCE